MHSRWSQLILWSAAVSTGGCSSTVDPLPIGELSSAITSLNEYARRCDEVILDDSNMPAVVPSFFCEDGTEVPQDNLSGDPTIMGNAHCDYPNRLNSECDPGSKFQVLFKDNSAVIVAHCRKQQYKGHAPGDGHFGDIAVIQYSKKNGATCLYQAGPAQDLFPGPGLPVPPPSNDPSHFWQEPVSAHSCVQCHNNGPLIRSQYLSQLFTGKDALPEQLTFNTSTHDMHVEGAPYWFPGSDFSPIHVFAARVTNNACMSCHRLGISATVDGMGTPHFNGGGTASTFGPTSVMEPPQIPAQNPPREDPPGSGHFLPERWMIPPFTTSATPDPATVQAATDVASCATSVGLGGIAPPGCSLVDITTPAIAQLGATAICPASNGQFAGNLTVSVQNMNSPLAGSITVDGVDSPFSTAVGQLTYQTPFSYPSTTQSGYKTVGLTVTDANGRTATNSARVLLPPLPQGCYGSALCDGTVDVRCTIQLEPLVLKRWNGSGWTPVATDPGNNANFLPELYDSIPQLGQTLYYEVCVQDGYAGCNGLCAPWFTITTPPSNQCAPRCTVNCGPQCGVPGKPPCHKPFF